MAMFSLDVRLAAIAMISACANYKGRHGSDGSLKWADTERYAGEEPPSEKVGLTTHLKKIMEQLLKRPNVRAR